MRRVFSAILTAIFLLGLWGCGRGTDRSEANTLPQPPSDQSSVTEPQVTQQPMVAIALPVVTEEHTSQDGVVLFRCVYQNMELTVSDQEIADAVIIDFLNRMDQLTAGSDDLLAQAEDAYMTGNAFNTYLSQITFAPKRIDQGVLSLFGENVIYTGSAHPEVTTLSLNYDLTTGKFLSSADIFSKSIDTAQLLQDILTSLEEKKDLLYEGYEDIVAETLKDCTNWFFSEDGLTFYFSPYEIGPYASGVITAEVSYDKLPGILLDAYFPAEKDVSFGELQIMAFDVEIMNTFTQTAEAFSGENGMQAVLYTNAYLENIRIERQQQTVSYHIFAAATLTPGDAIVIHAAPDDALQIHFTRGGEEVTKDLTLAAGTPSLAS